MTDQMRAPSDQHGDGGDGPETDREWSQEDYTHPAAGWGAARAVTRVLLRDREFINGPRRSSR